MASETTLQRHFAELGLLANLMQNLDYETQLVEQSAEVPYHTLLVELEPDPLKTPRQMALTFYPIDDDEFENILLLQYYLDLPFEVPGDHLDSVKKLLVPLNGRLVLGHFGMTENLDRVNYRYVQVLNSDELITEGMIGDVLILINYTTVVLGNAIAQFVAGELSEEQVKATFSA
jgi:hypothetical protein